MSTKSVKIAIVGSRDFREDYLIKETIKRAVDKFGEGNVTIISGGQERGADKYAKHFATTTNHVKYIEFPPQHYSWNEYCIKDKSNYNKEFDVSHYHQRNEEIAEYCDILIAFLPQGMPLRESRGTSSVVSKAKKLHKKVKVVN